MNNIIERTYRTVLAATAALALSLAPGIAVAAPGGAQSATYSSSEVGDFGLGSTIGLGFGSGWTSFRLTANPQYTVLQIAPKMYLDIAGHVGAAFGDGFTVFELVPAGRFRYVLNDKLDFYGDAGLGLAIASLPSYDLGYYGEVGGGSETWGLFRLASGVQFKVAPNISIIGEPIGMNVYFGTGSTFVYSIAGGVLFKF